MREVRTLYVDKGEEGVRLDRWFKRRWPHLNHIQIQKLTRSGQIRVDGARAKPDTRLSAGSQVRVPPLPDAPPPEEKGKLAARDIAYAKSLVIYEDEEVLALNKPSGLAVQGGTKTSKHVDRLLSAWGEGLERPRLVHRLDRDTSGVLVLGKTPAAAARLAGAFAKRRAEKVYWAIVIGFPKPGDGVLDLPLAKRGVGDREMMVPTDAKDERGEQARPSSSPSPAPAPAPPGWRCGPTPAARTSCAPTCWPWATRSWATPSTTTRRRSSSPKA